MMTLEREIAAWDGKSADDIAEVFQSHKDDPGFIDVLIKLLGVSACQKGATWLLKAGLNEANKLNSRQVTEIFSSLDSLQHWESKLHVLQSLPSLAISGREKRRVEAFLRSTLTDKNKFVRAWSYNGFYELSRQHPEYQQETEQMFAMAMRDEAASVKARIRNLMKKGKR